MDGLFVTVAPVVLSLKSTRSMASALTPHRFAYPLVAFLLRRAGALVGVCQVAFLRPCYQSLHNRGRRT
eukprot:1158779-Pelagomonas_calceolata.AAC.9